MAEASLHAARQPLQSASLTGLFNATSLLLGREKLLSRARDWHPESGKHHLRTNS